MNKKLICVYGSLRRGMGNHRLLEKSTFLGEFYTNPEYELYDLGSFPGVKTNGNTSILTEVFEVNDYESDRVDSLEGYKEGIKPTFYDKIYIDTPFGKAGMYIYMGKVYEPNKIESGDWVKYLENK